MLREGQYLMRAERLVHDDEVLIPSFDTILASDTIFPFVPIVREILTSLESFFEVPIDIEFVLDLTEDTAPEKSFFLVQIRPLASRQENKRVSIPRINREDVIIHSRNALGNGLKFNIPHIVYVPPESFSAENSASIAREIGTINARMHNDRYILIGP